jgi:uncharacterized membrane protein YgcG
VVSFPRDWLGPRDQLVPFGKDRESDLAAGPPEEAAPPPRPPRAADFWDEGAAAIHDAVEAADESGARLDARATARSAPARRTRTRALVAAGVIALAFAVVALVNFAGPSPRESRAQRQSAREASFGRPFLTLGISGVMARAEAAVDRAARSPSRAARPVRRSHPHSAPAIQVSVRPAVPSSHSAFTERALSAPEGSGSRPSRSTSSSSSGGGSGTGTGTGTSGGGGAGGSGAAGPTGEGALVSPGSTPSG